MTSPLLESYDAVAWSTVLEERLATAAARLSKAKGLAEEKRWLEGAAERLAAARAAHGGLLQQAQQLPELASVRAEQLQAVQGAAVDAVERLQAGITFHAGSRSPLLDSLFAKLKLPALRRAPSADFERFAADFEKRLSTQYARRLLGTPAFEFAGPVVEQVRASFGAWRSALVPSPLLPDAVQALEAQLHAAAAQLALPLQQVRLLAEAALAPLPGAYEESGLGARPKRRAAKSAAAEREPELPAAPVEPPAPAAPRKGKPSKQAAPVAAAAPKKKKLAAAPAAPAASP